MFTNCEVENKIHLIRHNKCQGFFVAQVMSSLRWASFLNRVSISLNQFCIVTTRNVGPVIKCAVSIKSKTRFSLFKIRIILGFATLKNGLCYTVYGNTGFGVFKQGVKNQKGFYLRINIGTQQKLLNFENWVDGRQKFSKIRVLKSIIFIFSEKKYLKLKSWLNY